MPNGGTETPAQEDNAQSDTADGQTRDAEVSHSSDTADDPSTTAVVTGLPPSIAEAREDLTPMLAQYADICARHDDALVVFQVGDFYEAFCEAAAEVARVCEVTLTQREDSTGEYPMAGIPIESTSYLEALLEAGYRVAVADQVERANEATGLVDRAVTQVITPGTVVEDELLDTTGANYVVTLTGRVSTDGHTPPERGGDTQSRDAAVSGGLAAVDVSTGECLVTGGDATTLREELERLDPAEVLTGPAAPSIESAEVDVMESVHDLGAFDRESASDRLESYLAAPDRRFETDAELRACGAALAYAEYTQGDDGTLEYVSRIRRYDPHDHLRLDAAAMQSLELFENRGLGASDTLFETIDETACAMGRRRLERWLRRPSIDPATVGGRHDAVAELVDRSLGRERLAELLSTAYDLERLIGRISRGRADARDLRSLHATLGVVPEVRETITPDGQPDVSDQLCDHLRELRERLDPVTELRELIQQAIQTDPPQEITDGGVIRAGFDTDLDELRATERDGREWIAALEADERERTGIDSLKVGHTEVHGYYIEVTNANLDRVPDDYQRRQTLKHTERYYTPALKRREDEILGAADRADQLEYELFTQVRDAAAAEVDRIQALADALAELDALRSLAVVATEYDYSRPEIREPDPAGDTVGADSGLRLEELRHPVVEKHTEFVPNEAQFPAGSLAIITGPNMSGKSTYMRAVATAVVLAQAGGFVPATAARLPIVDRVFTRVGASDDIAGGQSTFMREMSELSRILHDAGPESLVLLDEVGRGTSTADGEALAQAAAEFVHDELAATTLFATHYHGLTTLADSHTGIRNLHFTARRHDHDVTFLHRVASGPADESYGIEVAEMSGVPETVVTRARDLVDSDTISADGRESTSTGQSTSGALTTDHGEPATRPDNTRANGDDEEREVRESATQAVPDAVAETLAALDIATMTPLEALNTLHNLQREIDD